MACNRQWDRNPPLPLKIGRGIRNMPRFVVVTNGEMKTTSFAVKDEAAARYFAERYKKWTLVNRRIGYQKFIELPVDQREKLIEEEPLPDGFEIRRIYRQPRKTPRDYRQEDGQPSRKAYGTYNPPSKF